MWGGRSLTVASHSPETQLRFGRNCEPVAASGQTSDGSARAVITRPTPRISSALTAGSARTTGPSKLMREKVFCAPIASRPMPVMTAARPTLNATMSGGRRPPGATRSRRAGRRARSGRAGCRRTRRPRAGPAGRCRERARGCARAPAVVRVAVSVVVSAHRADPGAEHGDPDRDDEHGGDEVQPRVDVLGHEELREAQRHEPEREHADRVGDRDDAPSRNASRTVPRVPTM